MGIKEQIKCRDDMLKIIDNFSVMPPLIIICGSSGGGKKLLSKYFAEKFNYNYVECKINAENIDEVIKSSYSINIPTVYSFYGFKNIASNNSVMNKLLKITEEPPNKAHFIFTVTTLDGILSTLRSRAVVLINKSYNVEDLKNFTNDKLILEFAETPGDILIYQKIRTTMEFVKTVVENIDNVSLTNALKIPTHIALKEEDEETKLPLKVFLELISKYYIKQCINIKDKVYSNSCYQKYLITQKALYELNTINGIKKDSLLDYWIMSIRDIIEPG